MAIAKEVGTLGLSRTEGQRQTRNSVQGAGSPPGSSGEFVSIVEQAIRPIVEPPAASIGPEEFMWRYRRMRVPYTEPDTGQARTLQLDYRWYLNNSGISVRDSQWRPCLTESGRSRFEQRRPLALR